MSCLLIERFTTPPPIPKGQNLTQRTMEHFQHWGVEDELRAPQTLSDGRNVFDALGDGFTLPAFDADTDAFEQAARALGMPQTIVRDSSSGGREHYRAALVLVRPDQFAARASDDVPVDAVGLLQRVVGGRGR